MGHLSTRDKVVIRCDAWCDSPGIPEDLQKHWRIQTHYAEGAWINRHGDMSEKMAKACWERLSVPDGCEARLLYRGKEIDRKGEYERT